MKRFGNDLRRHWDRKQAHLTEVIDAGHVTIEIGSTRVLVTAPDSPKLNQFASLNGGRWRQRTGRWSLPKYASKGLIDLCVSLWGEGRVTVQ